MSKLSEAIEDYAKAIYSIAQAERDGLVLNGEVAERLGVTPATATVDAEATRRARPGRVLALPRASA